MNDCNFCPVETECYYQHKPCDCFDRRKFMDMDSRKEYDLAELERNRDDLGYGNGGWC